MMFHRPGRLGALALSRNSGKAEQGAGWRKVRLVVRAAPFALCLAILLGIGLRPAAAQQQQQQQPPKPPNPFETVPQSPQEAPKPAPQPAQPAQPGPPPAAQEPSRVTRPGQPPDNIIEAIEFRGARRVRQDTLQALIFTKKGDRFDEESLHREIGRASC